MTGKGHRLTGVGAGLFAAAFVHVLGYDYTAEILAALAAASSTTLPDWAEITRYKKGVRAGTFIPHRTITHWPVLWLGLMYAAFHYLDPYPAAIVLGICVGALAHIVADAPNPMGVPILWPHKRVSFFGGLWRSGEFEKSMTFVFTVVGLGFWAYVHNETLFIQTLIASWNDTISWFMSLRQ